MDNHIEIISERISALASTPLVTTHSAAQYSQLTELSFRANAPEATLDQLIYSIALHAQSIRLAIEQATASDDAVTADIYTEFSRTVDKHLWLLESHFISN